MASQFMDSRVYGAAWGTPELRSIFDEEARIARWLEILAVLAETEAEFGLIPADKAAGVAATCRAIKPDAEFLEEVRRGFEASGHSTQGMIQAVQKRCEGTSGEWLYCGATVQDLSDTWMMAALRDARAIYVRDLQAANAALRALAEQHRDTVMVGRTHGQQGLPITFGFKAAGWSAEISRHLRRLDEISARMDIGQLCGGVGSLSSLGPRAFEMQGRFLARLGLRAPDISWTSSRDVLAEWANAMMLITSTADRIGHEVYNLQRSEIGEVAERYAPGTVGSITMPHKRNPELSEHLGTLARVARHSAAMIAESLVHDHERDGRSWKVEWHAVPQISLVAGKALALLRALVADLDVDAERMLANIEASNGLVLSEEIMLALMPHVGRFSAHRLVYQAAAVACETKLPLRKVILEQPAIMAHLKPEDVEALFDYRRSIRHCGTMVDRVLGRCTGAMERAPA
jgi:adenylosuccinate lyase